MADYWKLEEDLKALTARVEAIEMRMSKGNAIMSAYTKRHGDVDRFCDHLDELGIRFEKGKVVSDYFGMFYLWAKDNGIDIEGDSGDKQLFSRHVKSRYGLEYAKNSSRIIGVGGES